MSKFWNPTSDKASENEVLEKAFEIISITLNEEEKPTLLLVSDKKLTEYFQFTAASEN